jgi:hypothetical protein
MDLVLMTKSVEINSNRFLIFYIDREIFFFTFTEFLMFIPITSEYMIGSVLWTMLKSEKTS